MIKIKISDTDLEEIKKNHAEWYESEILPTLKKVILDLEKKKSIDTLALEVEKYLELLKIIKNQGKDYVIKEDLMIGLDYLKINEYINIFKKIGNKRTKLEEGLDKLGLNNCKIECIFDYKKFSKGNKKWGRHEILNKMGLTVCPYCQRNYITSYKVLKKTRTTADLDHFLPKSVFPFLALSFYNFIPSCQVCNRLMKLDKMFYEESTGEIIGLNLYKEDFLSTNTKFDISNWDKVLLINKQSQTKIKIDTQNDKAKKNIKIFKLEEIYSEAHSKYVENLVETKLKYSEVYEKFLSEALKADEILIKELVEAPYRYKIENAEPLGKLTEDILDKINSTLRK